MIVGIGIDLVEISRIQQVIERFGERFIQKILHESEAAALGSGRSADRSQAARVAARFAAKEAGVKALGTGFQDGIGPRDIRIQSLPGGKPVITFHNRAATRARDLGVSRSHVSLTHARDSAGAVVILETDPGLVPLNGAQS